MQDARTFGLASPGRIGFARILSAVSVVILHQFFACAASGQTFSSDARKIGMGGDVDGGGNIASQMIEEQRSYRSILLPFGLIQVVGDRDRFNPSNDSFDPVRLLEDIANPLHYTPNRRSGGGAFVKDLVNAELKRDLNAYRGFKPALEISAAGLIAPSFGKTFKVKSNDSGEWHGFYLGAGPYLSLGTTFGLDEELQRLLASGENVSIPDKSFSMTDNSLGQAAAALVIGYRGRVGLPGRSSSAESPEGLYIAANYRYLRGFHYDTADLAAQFDTDSSGLLTLNPTTEPIRVDHLYAEKGAGRSIDIGVAAVFGNMEVGFAANGIANQIEWKEFSRDRYVLTSLIDGGDFLEQALNPGVSSLTVKLPVRYSGNAEYVFGNWATAAQVSRGLNGFQFHGGLERHLGFFDLRGGGRYWEHVWHPTTGIGLNFTRRFSLDLAAFANSLNWERERRYSIAVSLRFNRVSEPEPSGQR